MKAILLLAHGGPNTIDEVESVLKSIRGNKPVSEALLNETTRRYELIGGKSPLLDISCALAAKLETQTGIKTYFGMLHGSKNQIGSVVQKMNQDGVSAATVITLASFDNSITTPGYQKRLDGAHFQIEFISSIHGAKFWTQSLCKRIQTALSNKAHLIFTAHSLPENILEIDDPYVSQFKDASKQIAKKLMLTTSDWSMAYQSVPDTPIKWLGPTLEDTLTGLGARGKNKSSLRPLVLYQSMLKYSMT